MSDVTDYFSDRAEDYARFRPSYPAEAIRECLAGLPVPADVVDVGAGTGISARLFAEEGANVTAVEPNADMRAKGEAFAPGVRFSDGTAEATGLPDACADLVVCAQAFHWFDGEPALREFQRLLRPGGRLALIWNVRQSDVGFAILYHEAVVRAKRWAGSVNRVLRNARAGDPAKSGLFVNPRRVDFQNDHRLDWEQLLGRAASASYFPPPGPERDELTAFLRAAFDDHATHGRVVLAQVTEVTLCARS